MLASFPSLGLFRRKAILLRLIAIAFVGAMLLSVTLIPTRTAHAAPVLQAPPNCAVTYVHLDGDQAPTVKCLLEKTPGEVQPQIAKTLCNSNGWFGLYTGYDNVLTWCFGGGGSTTVGLNNVVGYWPGNNWGGFDAFGDPNDMYCFAKGYQEISTHAYITVSELWLYENPYGKC